MPRATIEIRGREKRWAVDWQAGTAEIAAMRADGLDVGIVENVIPLWIAELRLTRAWCLFQDLWNFKPPWR